MRRYCAETIFKCSENDPITRDLVRQCGGLDPLVAMVKNPKTKEDKPLLAAVTGAIWKTAITDENVERFDQLGTVQVSFISCGFTIFKIVKVKNFFFYFAFLRKSLQNAVIYVS